MPPSPSVSVWWTLVTTADPPPSRPSISQLSHSGRDRSNPQLPILAAKSSTVSKVAGLGATTRRRCQPRLNCSSTTHFGGASPTGGMTSRCRDRCRPGQRLHPPDRLGPVRTPSRTATETTSIRIRASLSIDHENASVSRMCTSTVIGLTPSGPVRRYGTGPSSPRTTPLSRAGTGGARGRWPLSGSEVKVRSSALLVAVAGSPLRGPAQVGAPRLVEDGEWPRRQRNCAGRHRRLATRNRFEPSGPPRHGGAQPKPEGRPVLGTRHSTRQRWPERLALHRHLVASAARPAPSVSSAGGG